MLRRYERIIEQAKARQRAKDTRGHLPEHVQQQQQQNDQHHNDCDHHAHDHDHQAYDHDHDHHRNSVCARVEFLRVENAALFSLHRLSLSMLLSLSPVAYARFATLLYAPGSVLLPSLLGQDTANLTPARSNSNSGIEREAPRVCGCDVATSLRLNSVSGAHEFFSRNGVSGCDS
jgi:hypothetical protein